MSGCQSNKNKNNPKKWSDEATKINPEGKGRVQEKQSRNTRRNIRKMSDCKSKTKNADELRA